MTEIKWQEPPDRRGSPRRDWGAIAKLLRSRPGEWALVDENVGAWAASYIKSGRLVAFTPAGSFEARSNGRGDGTADIYARYVGGEA